MIDLMDLPLFRSMPPEASAAITSTFQSRQLTEEQEVFRQGDPGDSLVVVLDGVFELVRRGSTGEVHLADVMPGDMLGHLSLVDGGRRSATMRALEPGAVAVLSRDAFDALWEQQDEVAVELQLQIIRDLIAELRSANRKLVDLIQGPLADAPDAIRRLLGSGAVVRGS